MVSLEESVHYVVDEPQSYLEWLYTATPEDEGSVRLGPYHRFLNVALTHEMHCLRYFREELAANGFPSNIHHAEHCLSMLREFTLCAADTALERGDQFQRNYTVDRVTGEHECMDIELFYGTLWKLWNKWVDVRDKVSESM